MTAVRRPACGAGPPGLLEPVPRDPLAADDASAAGSRGVRQQLGPAVLDQDDQGRRARVEGAAREGDVVLAQQSAHLALDAVESRQAGQQLRLDGRAPPVQTRDHPDQVEDPDLCGLDEVLEGVGDTDGRGQLGHGDHDVLDQVQVRRRRLPARRRRQDAAPCAPRSRVELSVRRAAWPWPAEPVLTLRLRVACSSHSR